MATEGSRADGREREREREETRAGIQMGTLGTRPFIRPRVLLCSPVLGRPVVVAAPALGRPVAVAAPALGRPVTVTARPLTIHTQSGVTREPGGLITDRPDGREVGPPSPSTLGKRLLSSRAAGENEGEELLGSEDENPARHSVVVAHPNPWSLRVEWAIQKVLKRLKFSNENTSLVEQFSKASTIK